MQEGSGRRSPPGRSDYEPGPASATRLLWGDVLATGAQGSGLSFDPGSLPGQEGSRRFAN
jgi:hypothetical protein